MDLVTWGVGPGSWVLGFWGGAMVDGGRARSNQQRAPGGLWRWPLAALSQFSKQHQHKPPVDLVNTLADWLGCRVSPTWFVAIPLAKLTSSHLTQQILSLISMRNSMTTHHR